MESKGADSFADETVLYTARRHWAVVLPPFLLLTFAGLSIPSKGIQAWALAAISLAWIGYAAKGRKATEYRLTKDHLLTVADFPWHKSSHIPLVSIKGADVYQPALGKFLDFGRVRVIQNDGSKTYLRMVDSPQKLADKINEARHFPLDSATS
jgi:hypothetical protein